MNRVGVLALLALVTACSSGSSHPSPSPSSPVAVSSGSAVGKPGSLPTPTQRAPEPKLPRRSVVPVSGKPLVDGYYFGFLKAVDLRRNLVRVDFAEWYSCKCTDDYNVRNTSKQIRSVPVDPRTTVTIFEGPPGQYYGTLRDLAASMTESRNQLGVGTYQGRFGGYWLRVHSGRIVRIDDIFTP